MIPKVDASLDDANLDEGMKRLGLNQGLSSPSLVKWSEVWMRENKLGLDKFKTYLNTCLIEWVAGTAKLVYPGDGSIRIVPVEDEGDTA